MASKAIQDILGWVALTKAVNAVKDGVPNPFPDWLFSVRAEDKIIGNSVKFNRFYGTRKAARRVAYGSPAHERELQQQDLVESKFISFGEKKTFDPYILQVLRNYESWDNANMAKQVVANEIKTLGTLFGNSRIVATATTLGKGAIYFDSDNNLLPTSSGSSITVSQQISATTNIGTIQDVSGSGIFGASGGGSWAVNTTDIPKQLLRLQEAAAQTHGYEPKVALYGKNIRSYISQNDYCLDFLAREGWTREKILTDTTLPNGLFGFEWVPVWKASFTKADGTKVSLWPADGITFLPAKEDAPAFWSMFEGSNLIPNSLDIQTDAMAALAAAEMVYGAHGYSRMTLDPLSLAITMMDCFLPAVRLPDVIYIADVVA